MSLSRGRISSIRPISWPCGRRAQTQSPTATREKSPLVRRAENSALKVSSPVMIAGKPRSSLTTQPRTSSSALAPACRARSQAAQKASR